MLFLKSKYLFLAEFFKDFNKFNKLKTQKENMEKKKSNVCNTASEFYNGLLLMNTMIYWMQKEVKKSPNMILISYFLKHMIMIDGLQKNN